MKEEVEGWTVLAESQATIDRFKQSAGRQARGHRMFAEAMEGLEAGIATCT